MRKGRARADSADPTFADLVAADGYDGVLARTTDATWRAIGETIATHLDVAPGRRVLEVGCGAGAVLWTLGATRASLFGVDYSVPHLMVARQALVLQRQRHPVRLCGAEAASLPFGAGLFDAVYAFGVFMYFSDTEYAERTIGEMLRVAAPSAGILITEIPDADRREETEALRRQSGANPSPPHLYYGKEFFGQIAERHRLRIEVLDAPIPDYANSHLRFSVLLRRPSDARAGGASDRERNRGSATDGTPRS